MNFSTLISLLRRSFTDWNDDDAPRLGAALALAKPFSDGHMERQDLL